MGMVRNYATGRGRRDAFHLFSSLVISLHWYKAPTENEDDGGDEDGHGTDLSCRERGKRCLSEGFSFLLDVTVELAAFD